jgi:lactoylglutathione lyase
MTLPELPDAPRTRSLSAGRISPSTSAASKSGQHGRASQANGTLLSAPRLTGDGFYEAVIADPDGNRIELVGA